MTLLAAAGADAVTVTGTQLSYALAVLLGAGTVALGLWIRHGKMLRRVLTEWELMLADWNGVADRPGVDGRPGVMVRMAAIEAQLVANGGSSLRDAVRRLEAGQRETAQQLAEVIDIASRQRAAAAAPVIQLTAGDSLTVSPAPVAAPDQTQNHASAA